jgi:hypothetical protein
MAAFDISNLLQNLTLEGNNNAIINAVNANWRVLPSLTASLGASILKTGKNDAAETEAAVKALTYLALNCMSVAEPYLLVSLPALLKAAAHKNTPIRTAAVEAVTLITSRMTPNSVREVLQYLFAAAKIEENWQTRALALKTIATFGDVAPIQLGCALPQVQYAPTPFFISTIYNNYLFIGCSRSYYKYD